MTTAEAARRQELYDLLGDLPPRSRPLDVQQITETEEERKEYILETLVLDLDGIEPVPAYFVRPKDGQGPLPVILYNHAHGGDQVLGKDELLAGRKVLQRPPYADILTKLGFAALCIDTWAFGERRGRSEGEIFRKMLWSGQVMWGMMVFDSLRARLSGEPPGRRSRAHRHTGLSMGSTMAWWLAALDKRVKVCIDICCLTDFEALIAHRSLEGHSVYYFVPGLLKHFTTARIDALIAPRGHLSLAGVFDPLTPPDGSDRIDAALREVYMAAGAADAWRLSRYTTGHLETAAMRAEIIAFLQRWL